MLSFRLLIGVMLVLLFAGAANGQTYTFECVSGARLTGDSCDICPNTIVDSRSFNGLVIYRDSVFWRWVDQPYSIRTKPGDIVEYWEHGANPYSERVTIPLSLTPYLTVQGMADSTWCNFSAPDRWQELHLDSLSATLAKARLTGANTGFGLRAGAGVSFDFQADTLSIISSSSAVANNGLSDNENGGQVRLGNRYMNGSDGLFSNDRKVNVNDFTLYFGDNTDSTLLAVFGADGRVGIRTTAASRALHVNGEVRVTDLVTDAPTVLVGADADGDLGEVSIGAGLSLAAGVLSSTITQYTDEQAQDAVGNIFVDGSIIDFTYNDAAPSITATVINNSIGNAQIRQGVAKSVVGVTGNATANVADIQATAADQVLRVNSGNTAVAWGQVATGGIADDAVTYAKIQNVVNDERLLGRVSGANGVVEELTQAQVQTFLGMTGVANRFALWTAANTLGSDAAFTFDAANDRATFAGTVAGSGNNNAFLNLNSGAITGTTEFLRMSGNINGNMSAAMVNANNASVNANTIFQYSVGGASAGDVALQMGVNGVVSHVLGVDNSDGDKVKLTMNAALPGENGDDGFTWSNTSPPRYGINIATPLHPLDVNGTARGKLWKNTGNEYTAANLTFSNGAGTGPTLTTIAGGGNHVEVDFTTGTSPTNNGLIFTVNYPYSFGTNSTVTFSSAHDNTSTDYGKFKIDSSGPLTFEVRAVGTLAASTQYKINFTYFGY